MNCYSLINSCIYLLPVIVQCTDVKNLSTLATMSLVFILDCRQQRECSMFPMSLVPNSATRHSAELVHPYTNPTTHLLKIYRSDIFQPPFLSLSLQSYWFLSCFHTKILYVFLIFPNGFIYSDLHSFPDFIETLCAAFFPILTYCVLPNMLSCHCLLMITLN
jgi:hypothetical protein